MAVLLSVLKAISAARAVLDVVPEITKLATVIRDTTGLGKARVDPLQVSSRPDFISIAVDAGVELLASYNQNTLISSGEGVVIPSPADPKQGLPLLRDFCVMTHPLGAVDALLYAGSMQAAGELSARGSLAWESGSSASHGRTVPKQFLQDLIMASSTLSGDEKSFLFLALEHENFLVDESVVWKTNDGELAKVVLTKYQNQTNSLGYRGIMQFGNTTLRTLHKRYARKHILADSKAVHLRAFSDEYDFSMAYNPLYSLVMAVHLFREHKGSFSVHFPKQKFTPAIGYLYHNQGSPAARQGLRTGKLVHPQSDAAAALFASLGVS